MLQHFRKQSSLLGMLVAFSLQAPAQSIAQISLKETMEKMPKLPAEWQPAEELYASVPYGETPAEQRSAIDEMLALKKSILQSLFEKFQTNSKRMKTDKAFYAGLGQEEQKMLRDFYTLETSWQQGSFDAFNSWIESRPGITRQSWTKIKEPLSTNGNNYYQQLAQLDKHLKSLHFLAEVYDREGVFLKVPEVDDLNENISKELSAVPTIRKKLFEGSDVVGEIADPKKTIDIMEKGKNKIQQAYQRNYLKQTQWWYQYFKEAEAAARKFDNLVTATNFGASLTGADKQLLPVMADVQENIVNILWHLLNAEKNIAGLIPMAKLSLQSTDQAIEQVKKMQAE